MTELKEISLIVKWSGKEFPISDLSDQDTVAVLKHEIFKATNVRPERQKLINLRHKGKFIVIFVCCFRKHQIKSLSKFRKSTGGSNTMAILFLFKVVKIISNKNSLFGFSLGKPATENLKLIELELKQNFKLMMVGSLEIDIENVCSIPFHQREVIDDFDDDHDDKTPLPFHKMDVSCTHTCYFNVKERKKEREKTNFLFN